MKKNIIVAALLFTAFHVSGQTNSYPLYTSGAYAGGTGDQTNITGAPLKLQSSAGYIRVPHLSAAAGISIVYNYEAGKNVYWGEDTDGGQYLFRGRDVNIGRGLTVNGTMGVGMNNLPWVPTTGVFEVRGGATLGSATGSNRLLTCTSIGAVASATNYYQNNIWVRRDAPGSDWLTASLHNGISIDGSYLTPGVDTRTWWERSPFKDIQSWGNANQTYLTINQGNVGIGTTTPQEKLHIEGNVYVGTNQLQFLSASGGNNRIQSAGGSVFGSWTFKSRFDHIIIDAGESAGNERKIFFRTAGSDRMLVDTNGNVGIGTTDPKSFKLAVNGKIWGTEVQVALTNPGPDYVFEPTYHLKPLAEIETYIKENKHLPEVPSAKEMEKNGVQLGEMNMLLLKKVEELTLYVIEQNRKIEKLQDEVSRIKNIK